MVVGWFVFYFVFFVGFNVFVYLIDDFGVLVVC